MQRSDLRRSITIALILCATLAGCFEDPVSETLEIQILPEDRARITARTTIAMTLPPENEAAADRVAALRASLLNESDHWSTLFRGLRPIEERYLLEWERGTLKAVERSAVVERNDIENLFRGSSISVFVTRGDGWSEMAIYPGKSSRATREQRETLQDQMRAWSVALQRYFVALDDLVSYLEEHPDRRRAVWTVVFSDLLHDSSIEEISELEATLAEDLLAAIEKTWKVFEIQGEQAFSLQQIGYLVYDPFPSDLAIEVPGDVLESEGFQKDGKMLTIERVGLWEAFESLRRGSITNDPLAAWMNAAGEENEEFDLDQFLLVPVELDVSPSASEIVDALETRLRPSSLYRVRWRE